MQGVFTCQAIDASFLTDDPHPSAEKSRFRISPPSTFSASSALPRILLLPTFLHCGEKDGKEKGGWWQEREEEHAPQREDRWRGEESFLFLSFTIRFSSLLSLFFACLPQSHVAFLLQQGKHWVKRPSLKPSGAVRGRIPGIDPRIVKKNQFLYVVELPLTARVDSDEFRVVQVCRYHSVLFTGVLVLSVA